MNISYLLLFLSLIISNQGFACEMISAQRHINPDSSEGGLVNSKAKVEASSYLAYGAKVCDSAWVDGNAKVLGEAVIKGNAWVRDFSTVKDKAVIDENAVLWGNRGFPVLVEGEAQIYGSAKILAGTTVSDLSRIYGNASLRSSKVSGKGKVCENYILSNQHLAGDYFCPEGRDVPSVADLKLLSVNVNSLNVFPAEIRFQTSIYDFSMDVEGYQIFVNNNQVLSSAILIDKNELVVSSIEHLREGDNTITFKGRDLLDKTFDKAFNFILGASTKKIQIESASHQIDDKMVFSIDLEREGQRLGARWSYNNGELSIFGIPSDSESYSLEIKGVGEKSVIAEKYGNLDIVPSVIISSLLPTFQSNDTSLQNLSTWNISHPEQISLGVFNKKRSFSIKPHDSEIVEVAKTFKLNGDTKTLNVNAVLSSLSGLSGSKKIKVILASSSEKKIKVYDYTSLEIATITDQASPKEQSFQVSKNSYKDVEYSLVIRLFPIDEKEASSNEEVIFSGVLLRKIVVDFSPQNFSPRNKRFNMLFPTDGSFSCTTHLFDINEVDENFEYVRDNNLEYFSAGPIFMMPDFKENRIFGDLTIDGIHSSNVSNLYLVGIQDGKDIFKENLSLCSQIKFDEWKYLGNSSKITISDNNNLANYLFAVSKENLEQVIPSRYVNGRLYDNKIGLKVVVELLNPIEGKMKYESEVQIKNVLSTPDLSEDVVYKLSEKVEDYDSQSEGMLRTGGDKWIRPIYAPVLKNIMSEVNKVKEGGWKINDISKLNNGYFPEHSRHQLGIEVDLLFGDKGLNLNEKESLDRIEDFLDKAKAYHGYVRDYLLTVPESENSLFQKRFLNRCLGDRFISLVDQRGTGSLIRDASNHEDHMHLMFHGVGRNDAAWQVTRDLPKDTSLEDFELNINNSGELVVIIKEERKDNYKGKKITWRYHNKEGYGDASLIVKHGIVDKNATRADLGNTGNHSPELRYIYLAITNETYPLWCVEKKAFVEL